MANPYLAFALIIWAGIHGIKNRLELPASENLNLYKTTLEALSKYRRLPQNLGAACMVASQSDFVRAHIPSSILDIYCGR